MPNNTSQPNSAFPINQSLSDSKASRKSSTPGPGSSKTSSSDNDALQQKAFKDQEREKKISLALTRVSEGLSYRQAAKEIGISFGTVYGRFRGRKSRIRAQEVRMKLSFLEETIIEKVLLALICIGKPATQPFFVHTVNIILQAQGEIGVERVSRQWYRHFRRRHPSIDARDFSSLYKPPAKDPSNELSLAWFKYFERICRNFRVLPENIYAMDEQGFSYTAGYSSSTNSSWQNTMPQTASESYGADASNANTSSSRDTGSVSSHSSHNSDENLCNGKKSETPPAISMGAPPPDFFIMLNTVCGDGTAIPPYLALESKFAEKVSAEYPKDWSIHTSKSGWPNEKMLLQWIMHHFDPLTAPKAKGNQRILILDTHVGHFSLPFLQFGMDNNITFLFIPPHARGLHPLDVPPLSDFRQDVMSNTTEYQQAIDRLLMAHNTVFNNPNIKRSWRDAGLIPFDPSVVRPPKYNFKHRTQSPLTPVTDDYESSSSQSTGCSPSRYAPIWPNERPIFKYIEVLDFNFDSFSAPSPERRISPSSNTPLFPDDPEEEDEEEDDETPQPVPTDDIINAFSSFDLNTYAPNPSKIFSTDSSDSDSNYHFHKSMSSDLFKTITKASNVLKKNKVLAAHSIEYHSFLSGFLERLSDSLHQLSGNLKNNNLVKPDDLEHLKLLETEVKVVESYNKEISAQIEPSIKANENMASLLQQQIDDDSIPFSEPSHKRGIRSVESKSSDEDVQHQRHKGTGNNPMDVANINNAEEYDNESHQFVKPKFVFNSPFPSQEQQEEQQNQNQQYQNQDSSISDNSNTEQENFSGTDNSLKLPYLSNNFFNNSNSTLLPPLQFGNQDQQMPPTGGPTRNTDPTRLAQYFQSPSTDKYRNGSK